jgi:hypothetical protein
MEWHQNAHYVGISQSAFRHATGNPHIKLLDSGKDKVDGIKWMDKGDAKCRTKHNLHAGFLSIFF